MVDRRSSIMTNTTPDADVERVLSSGDGGASGHSPRRRWFLILIAVGIAGLILMLVIGRRRSRDDVRYVTEEVRRGDLSVRVSATGNLQPRRQVDVGTELSGTVVTVLVDVNDRVRRGQVLAELDTAKLADEVERSRASLRGAEARVTQTLASVAQTGSELARLRDVHARSEGRVPAKIELESAEAAHERALGDDRNARTQIEEARAALETAETNVAKASIRSPIDGVILARNVEPGQTVAAAFQVATLFTIAEDLAQMEVEVAIDEADVSSVREGQPAVFTVDAYPDRDYDATVTRVNLGSSEAQGVVSYATTLQVPNADLSLRPGMTASADIITMQRNGALLVPNAALQFTPAAAIAEQENEKGGGGIGSLLPRPPGAKRSGAVAEADAAGPRRVWVIREDKPVPITVTTGATDGRMTEITAGALREGMAVLVAEVSKTKDGGAS